MTSFTCPRCLRTSSHPEDARQGYCGYCHDWTAPRANGLRDEAGVGDGLLVGGPAHGVRHPRPAGAAMPGRIDVQQFEVGVHTYRRTPWQTLAGLHVYVSGGAVVERWTLRVSLWVGRASDVTVELAAQNAVTELAQALRAWSNSAVEAGWLVLDPPDVRFEDLTGPSVLALRGLVYRDRVRAGQHMPTHPLPGMGAFGG